jgi:1,4-alpha-glucan branching enzyme
MKTKCTIFSFVDAKARSVAVAGSFNNWNADALPLRKKGKKWEASITLPPGRYEYRFVVDGGRFVDDPHAHERCPNPFGEQNCVLVVG